MHVLGLFVANFSAIAWKLVILDHFNLRTGVYGATETLREISQMKEWYNTLK